MVLVGLFHVLDPGALGCFRQRHPVSLLVVRLQPHRHDAIAAMDGQWFFAGNWVPSKTE